VSLAQAHAHRTDWSTSFDAADRPRAGIMALVRETLRANPRGLTDSELLSATGLPEIKRGSVIKRRQDAGAVPVLDDENRPVTRLTPSGRPSIVWRLP
jgi:hypothetical protein